VTSTNGRSGGLVRADDPQRLVEGVHGLDHPQGDALERVPVQTGSRPASRAQAFAFSESRS
jgi:hypothetical protein